MLIAPRCVACRVYSQVAGNKGALVNLLLPSPQRRSGIDEQEIPCDLARQNSGDPLCANAKPDEVWGPDPNFSLYDLNDCSVRVA